MAPIRPFRSLARHLTAITSLAVLEAAASSAIPALRKRLGDDDQLVRKCAGLAIVHIEGNRADIPAIIKAMSLSKREIVEFQDETSHFLEHRAVASKRIRNIGVSLVSGTLPELKYRNSFHQRQAIRTLGEIGPPAKEAIPELKALLNSDDNDTREAAVEALKRIDPSAVPAVLRGDSTK